SPLLRGDWDQPADGPWLRVELWIVNRLLVGELIRTDAAPTLGHLQRVAVAVAVVVEPGAVSEIDCLDDEGVAIPAADRIAEERRLPGLPVRSPVRVNHPEVVHVFVQKDHLVRELDIGR